MIRLDSDTRSTKTTNKSLESKDMKIGNVRNRDI